MVEVGAHIINGARIEIAPNYDALSDRLTEVYLGRVAAKPDLITLTSTGTTPLGWYSRLAEYEQAHNGTFRDVVLFNLDEYCRVDETGCTLLDGADPRSYQYYMRPIAASLGVKANHLPGADNYDKPGAYDKQIEQAGGIDFAVLGLGIDHACGFNFAGSPLDSVTRHVSVSQLTREINAGLTETEAEAIPTDAITAGVGTVMKSAEIWTIAHGERKGAAVWQAIFESVSSKNPATVLRTHPNHTFLVDRAAARLLNV